MSDERDRSAALAVLPFAKRAPRSHTFRPRKQIHYPDPAFHYPGVAFTLACIDDSDLAAIAKFKCSELADDSTQNVYDMMDSIRTTSRRSPRRRAIRHSASLPCDLIESKFASMPERQKPMTPPLSSLRNQFAVSAPVKRNPRRIIVKRKSANLNWTKHVICEISAYLKSSVQSHQTQQRELKVIAKWHISSLSARTPFTIHYTACGTSRRVFSSGGGKSKSSWSPNTQERCLKSCR